MKVALKIHSFLSTRKKKVLFLILILVLVNTVLYVNTLKYDFLKDDFPLIVNNQRIKNFDSFLSSLSSQFFTFPDNVYLNYWRPMTLFTFYLDYHFYGLNPAGFHLTNIILNVLCSLAVFFIFTLIFSREYFSFFIAILFSAHPAHVGVVSWISGRTDMLGTLFLLSALILLILFFSGKERKRSLYILSFFFFFAGLLSKESVLIFPLIATILVPLIFFLKKGLFKINIGRALFYTIPFWVGDGLFLILHNKFSGNQGILTDIFSVNITTVLKAIGAYTKMIVFPFFKTPYFSMSDINIYPISYLLFSLIGISLIVFIFIKKEKFPMTIFSTLLVIYMLPVINPDMVPSYPKIALRFVYLPVVFTGTFMLEAIFCARKRSLRILLIFFLIIMSTFWFVRSVGLQRFFEDQESYYNEINGLTAYHENDSSLLLPLALNKAQKGKINEALQYIERALKFNKNDKWKDIRETGNMLKANLLIASGKRVEGKLLAEKINRETKEKEIKYFSYLVLAKYYEKEGELEQSLRLMNKAVEISETPDINFRIAVVLWKSGRINDALIHVDKAVAKVPSNKIYRRLQTALERIIITSPGYGEKIRNKFE